MSLELRRPTEVIYFLTCVFFLCQDYLQSFWSDLQAAHELFSSISQAQQETEGDDGEKEFPEHLPAEVLEAGIKSERYIQVKMYQPVVVSNAQTPLTQRFLLLAARGEGLHLILAQLQPSLKALLLTSVVTQTSTLMMRQIRHAHVNVCLCKSEHVMCVYVNVSL